MPTATPLNEDERLAVLRECRILDTERERAYDDVVALAAHLGGVPIALVSFVDETRQWAKAACGIERREIPREASFCNHVVGSGGPLEVPDATRDPRFETNPFVLQEPRIRYYFGVPLRMEGGHVVGSLCLIDRVPRRMDEVRRGLLEDLAGLVVDQLEARRRNRRLAEALERVSTLEALLPMCAGCKKVRQEKGYWRQVEGYLLRQGTTVTHGLCPACEAEIMREM